MSPSWIVKYIQIFRFSVTFIAYFICSNRNIKVCALDIIILYTKCVFYNTTHKSAICEPVCVCLCAQPHMCMGCGVVRLFCSVCEMVLNRAEPYENKRKKEEKESKSFKHSIFNRSRLIVRMVGCLNSGFCRYAYIECICWLLYRSIVRLLGLTEWVNEFIFKWKHAKMDCVPFNVMPLWLLFSFCVVVVVLATPYTINLLCHVECNFILDYFRLLYIFIWFFSPLSLLHALHKWFISHLHSNLFSSIPHIFNVYHQPCKNYYHLIKTKLPIVTLHCLRWFAALYIYRWIFRKRAYARLLNFSLHISTCRGLNYIKRKSISVLNPHIHNIDIIQEYSSFWWDFWLDFLHLHQNESHLEKEIFACVPLWNSSSAYTENKNTCNLEASFQVNNKLLLPI